MTRRQRRAELIRIMEQHGLDTKAVAALTHHALRTVQCWLAGERNVRASTLALLRLSLEQREVA